MHLDSDFVITIDPCPYISGWNASGAARRPAGEASSNRIVWIRKQLMDSMKQNGYG